MDSELNRKNKMPLSIEATECPAVEWPEHKLCDSFDTMLDRGILISKRETLEERTKEIMEYQLFGIVPSDGIVLIDEAKEK